MKNKLLALIAILSVLTILASWLLSAMGLVVNNLLCEEGLRWLLMHGMDGALASHVSSVLLLVVAIGAISICRRESLLRREGIYLIVLWVIILAFVLWPSSPMRGINGGLYPSPFFKALPAMVCLSIVGVSLCLIPRKAVELLTYGIRKCAIWIVLYVMLAFLYNLVDYIWI